jgi:hypothetical protein
MIDFDKKFPRPRGGEVDINQFDARFGSRLCNGFHVTVRIPRMQSTFDKQGGSRE